MSDSLRRPRVAILGRPNVGKSTLFNILTERRTALVLDQPGVTRDIHVESVEIWGLSFDIMDTGGLTDADDAFSPLIRVQVLRAIRDVDALYVVMDGRAGLLPQDREILRIAKESGKPFLILVNKVDKDDDSDFLASDFYQLNFDFVLCAFEKRMGVSDALEWLRQHLPTEVAPAPMTDESAVRVAIVGKPNVGKSSLVNRLVGDERMLVSDVAGTTVDAIDSRINYDGEEFILIDTAGLRRSGRRKDDVEKLSYYKTVESIERADITLLMVDAVEGPTEQDAKILHHILEKGRGVILVANKCDIAEETVPAYRQLFREKVERNFHFFPDITVMFISAHTNLGIKSLFQKIKLVWSKLNIRIPTSQLNDFFTQVIRKAPAPVYGTKNVKFFYLTQTQQIPPSFIAFANFPQGVTPSYRRFLVKRIQERWDMEGIPVRIYALKKGGQDKAKARRLT